MGLESGIVGLPNAGKSTLFNALTATSLAETANYPFCTIEPNVGIVAVADKRLEKLAHVCGSQKIIPTQLRFVDIAGLVKGASQGEGLGNQFLGHIREVDAIVHVVRCFPEEEGGSNNPIEAIATVETELLLADLQSLERQLASARKQRTGEGHERIPLLEKALEMVSDGQAVSSGSWDEESYEHVKRLGLLTAKPVMYVCNVREQELSHAEDLDAVQAVAGHARGHGRKHVVISAQIESEIALLPEEERGPFLQALGLEETGLSQIVRASYELLSLHTFFTVGPKEAHAWTIKRGASAYEAAGQIHSDFQKGFIRAEVIAYEDYVSYENMAAIKAAGKMRLEGRDAIIHDGSIVHFHFNV